MGRCPQCGTWESLIEERAEQRASGPAARESKNNAPLLLGSVSSSDAHRLPTTIAEFDRVLGGGLVHGSIILIGGDPGMGKSTLLLQACAAIGQNGDQVLYVTGEESLQQIRERADRLELQPDVIHVASETSAEAIASMVVAMKPALAIVDSIQTLTTDMLESTAGTVAQVRECAALLAKVAKGTGVPVILIGHVTKDGYLAGPKVLEHIVDAVLQFEGDGTYSYRVLRSLKNRYGSTNEIGLFEMTGKGMREVFNPSDVLMSGAHSDQPGTAVSAVMEGTRPLLIEVQALVAPSGYANPQRVTTGYDGRRLQLLLAVLERRGGVSVRQSDVFVNVTGGITIQDPALDLAVAMAIASSTTDVALPGKTAFIGEIGLTGEIRRVGQMDQRVNEALRLGVETVFVPESDKYHLQNVVQVARLHDVISRFR